MRGIVFFGRRLTWTVSFCLLLVVFVIPVWAAETFKIAQFEPVSGPFKRNGDQYVAIFRFLVEEINERGGILGRKVEVIVEDSQLKPDVAVRKATKDILEGVKVILSGTGSNIASAIADLAAKEKVICITNAAEGAFLTGKDCNPYFFRVSPNTEQRSMAIAHFLAGKPFRKFALINQDYSFGHEAAEGFKRRVKQFIPDSQMVADEFHPLALKDFAPYVSKVAALKPDVIFTANWGGDLSNLIKQSRELGIKTPLMCYYLSEPTDVLQKIENGAIGSWTCDGCFETLRTPGVKDLVQRWRKNPAYTEFEKTPQAALSRTYNGMKFFFEAVKKGGSFDVDKIIHTWEGMRWEGITGQMIMRAEDHQVLLPIFVAEIVPTTNEFYPFPYVGEPFAVPLEKTTVPVSETGCMRKKGQL